MVSGHSMRWSLQDSQLTAKQWNTPAPPVLTRLGWLHPRLGCDEFHDPLFPPRLLGIAELGRPDSGSPRADVARRDRDDGAA